MKCNHSHCKFETQVPKRMKRHVETQHGGHDGITQRRESRAHLAQQRKKK